VKTAKAVNLGRPRRGVAPLDRLLRKVIVDPATGCWIWTGTLTKPGGYGQFKIDGANVCTHRWAYTYFRGPIPDGLVLDHVGCDRPPCCNPWHVTPTTDAVNTMRGGTSVGAVNAAKTHCLRGHEFTPENTYRQSTAGTRGCKTCRTIDSRNRYRRRKGIPPDAPLMRASSRGLTGTI